MKMQRVSLHCVTALMRIFPEVISPIVVTLPSNKVYHLRSELADAELAEGAA